MIDVEPLRVFTYAELRAAGHSRRRIERAVRAGELLRVRRGRYIVAGSDMREQRAAALGGQIDCLSLLASVGVFVLESRALHIVVPRGASRLGPLPHDVVRHWRARGATESRIVHALARACRCQTPRAAIATLDSACHRGLVDEADLAEVFALLPARYGALRQFIDPRCESGPESLVRLMLRRLGRDIRPQVEIDGVGRVDFLVDGWLIIECDSREFHSEWQTRRHDYRRDLVAAARGYGTLRLNAEDIMFDADAVLEALRGATSARPRVHNSSRKKPTATPTCGRAGR